MKKERRSSLERTAYHEAGHAVAAFNAGFRLKEATIIPGAHKGVDYLGMVSASRSGIGRAIEYDVTPARKDRVEKCIVALHAGVLAERHFDGRRHNWQGARSDLLASSYLVSYIAGSLEEEETYLHLLHIRAKKLVELYWAQIEAVASELIKSSELPGDDVAEIIRRALTTRGVREGPTP